MRLPYYRTGTSVIYNLSTTVSGSAWSAPQFLQTTQYANGLYQSTNCNINNNAQNDGPRHGSVMIISDANAKQKIVDLLGINDTPLTAQPQQTLYRLYNPITSEHLWTPDKTEYDSLCKGDWLGEGSAWVSVASSNPSAKAVWRLYNPILNQHHYTTDSQEAISLRLGNDWVYDNSGYPMQFSGGDVPLYRLYNPGLSQHHITANAQERDSLIANEGWQDEGISMYAVAL